MARVTVVEPDRFECSLEGCHERKTEHGMVDGSYCSEECAARATGADFLDVVRHDHRFCWSCFRQRKEIERPTAEARRDLGPVTDDALVGYEYPTEHVSKGEWGLECTCGAVDHDTPAYDARDSVPYYWFLYLIADQLVADGHRDDGFDLETLADEHWQTGDLELAAGRALRA